MEFLTNEKLTIVGAAGMIGSNMAQTAMMMRLTPNICLYDPFAPALEGVAEELYHCGFEGVNLTFTSDIKEALTGASYIVSSGGALCKASPGFVHGDGRHVCACCHTTYRKVFPKIQMRPMCFICKHLDSSGMSKFYDCPEV